MHFVRTKIVPILTLRKMKVKRSSLIITIVNHLCTSLMLENQLSFFFTFVYCILLFTACHLPMIIKYRLLNNNNNNPLCNNPLESRQTAWLCFSWVITWLVWYIPLPLVVIFTPKDPTAMSVVTQFCITLLSEHWSMEPLSKIKAGMVIRWSA